MDTQSTAPAEEQTAAQEDAANPVAPAPWQQQVRAWIDRLTGSIDRINEFFAPAADDDPLNPVRVGRKPILFGAWMVVGVFGFLGLWSAVAPLASAAIAPGKVILSGNKKTIQHLEGGIVEEIYVREGTTIQAGKPLIRLNETAARARLDLYRKQLLSAKAAEARQVAERDGLEEIPFPPEVEAAKRDPEVAEVVLSQQRLFDSRMASIESQTGLLEQKKLQFEKEIGGLEAQIDSATQQIALLEEEIGAVKKLLASGNAQKPRLLALQRAQAELSGNRGEYEARISRAQQSIAEADLEIVNIRNEFQNKVAAEMKETVDQIADLQERMKASTDIIDRIIITAPLSGVVSDLQTHTIGGVIRPGDKIMDIVPIDELVIETMVSPQDIDVVHPGLEARVRLTAYKARNVPPLLGTVTHVSPDRFENRETGQAYYATRIQIEDKELKTHGNLELTPGMPAEALIITGQRTLLAYLMDPITSSFRNAFREQ